MKIFESVKLEIVVFTEEDIVRTSGGITSGGDGFPAEGDIDFS